MKFRKIMYLLIFAIVFNFTLPELSFAAPNEMDYRDLIRTYRDQYGYFDTPVANFDVFVNGVRKGGTNVDPYTSQKESYTQLTPEFTVKVGDVIEIVDKSEVGEGNRINLYDLQVAQGVVGNTASRYKSYSRLPQTIEAEMPGKLVIFLNVADNYSKIPRFDNFSQYGNWRSEVIKSSGDPNIQIKGWYFTAFAINVEPAELEPEPEEPEEPGTGGDGDLWVKIKVPVTVERNKSFDVKQVSEATYGLKRIEWYEDGKHVPEHDGKYGGYKKQITKDTRFGVKVTDFKDKTAYDEALVKVIEKVEPELYADLFFWGEQPPIKVSLENYMANKEMTVNWLLDAGNTAYINTELGVFQFFQNVEDSEIRKYEGNMNQAKNDPNFIEEVTISTTRDPSELEYATGWGTFKFRPQDPTIKGSVLIQSRPHKGLYSFATAYKTLPIDVDSIPPETELTVPYPFYPKEIDNPNQKTITWTYESEQNIPYKHSVVSLYKIVDGRYEEVFRNRIMADRKLVVEGNADEEYKIEVKVVDQIGKSSSIKSKEFIIIGARPIIDIELDNITNPEVLEIEVFNKTPQEIESLFPTSYTYWTIHDSQGKLVVEGEGEAPKSVDLDDRFYRGRHIVTQHAINTLGNTAEAYEDFEISSVIDFIPEPQTQFEDDMIYLNDTSKYITDKRWFIRGSEDVSFSDLIVNSNNEFTRDEGVYEVRLRGIGYYAGVGEREAEVTKIVEFLSTKPTAAYKLMGTLKMYKEIVLDGTISEEMTEERLQSKYPILFDHERTRFAIEPITEPNGEVDLERLQYILGEGKEVINNQVIFKAKRYISIRVDREGWYRGYYKVYNGRKESDWYISEFYVSPELLPTVDINIGAPVVYRDPEDELKSKLEVIVSYSSPDDEIDLEQSRLFISYDKNNDENFVNDGLDSMQWLMKDSQNLLSYFSRFDANWGSDKATFSIYTDSPDKNIFGKFKFEFEAVEKPLIPNFGDAPVMTADTFLLDDTKKIILIDNDKPKIFLETNVNNLFVVYILEDSGEKLTEAQINSIIQRLNIERVNIEVYIIDAETDSIRKYN